MSKLMYEIEINNNNDVQYIYLETDDDIDIDIGVPDKNAVTHITVIDTDIDVEPDLVILRRIE